MTPFHALGWLLLVTTLAYAGAAAAFRIGLTRRRPHLAAGPEVPFVSVVVAARNEEAYIGGCIQSLVQQTCPADRYEVLIVDDGSEDRTLEIARQAAEHHANLRVLTVGDAFPDMAAKKRPMSVGVQAARGDIILTTDADCRVPPTWVAATVAHFEPDVCAVVGFSQIKDGRSPLTFLERLQGLDFLALMTAAAGAARLGVALAASGQNLAYRKAAFQQVGGFARIGHRPSGDDVLLLQLLRRASAGRIRFATGPDSHVSTWRSETLGGLLRQRKRWASNALVQARLNPPFFAYILSVFLLNILLPVAFVAAVFGLPVLLPLSCLGGKAAADWLVIAEGARTFNRRDLLGAFPTWELLQMPYILWVGLSGSLFGFVWKGRRHNGGRRHG